MKRYHSLAIITLGLVTNAIAYQCFLNPFMISVGGITGISVLLEAYAAIPYTLSLTLLNAGLFIWGLKAKGLAYTLRSLAAMIASGLLLDIPFPLVKFFVPSSPVCGMICGSLISGIGYGLIISQNTSTGGSDLLGMIITKANNQLSTGMVMTFLDLLVIIVSGIFEGIGNFLSSLFAMALCNSTIDITAYLLGGAPEPSWMHWLKARYKQLRKHLVTPKVTVNLYCLIASCCIFLIIGQTLMFYTPIFKA